MNDTDKPQGDQIDRITVAKDLMRATVASDSWGEVEDQGSDCRSGRYGVMVFFDSAPEAENFRHAVAAATSF